MIDFYIRKLIENYTILKFENEFCIIFSFSLNLISFALFVGVAFLTCMNVIYSKNLFPIILVLVLNNFHKIVFKVKVCYLFRCVDS